FIQPLDENQSFDLYLNDPSFTGLSPFEQYKKCTQNLQWIIKTAQENQLNIRAMGSGWSLSKVAVSEDALINTKRLRHKFTLDRENFSPELLADGLDPDDYRFLQCGNTIIGINEYLEKKCLPPKSLRVSGGSNGQTIVGAFSTGTHGAAMFYGALPEMVLGIHVVTGPNSHYYIERASNKITSPIFHHKLGAKTILDDELFNAVLVSFGSFGIIHGVLVEIEPRYLLEQKRNRIAFDSNLENAICQGDISLVSHHLKYPLGMEDNELYHFELALNPHDFEYNDPSKGLYLRTMYKGKYKEGYKPIDTTSEGYTYGDDTLGIMQTVLDKLEANAGFLNRALVPKLVNSLFNLAYDRPEEAFGTIGETFRNTIFRGKLFSAAFGIDCKDFKSVVDICLDINKTHKLAGILAMRFVRGSKATLGFTRWERSCVLEIDGVDASINHQFVKLMAEKMEARQIPYALHWGKINRILDKERVLYMFGEERVKSWKRQRSRIMDKEIQEMFNNEFMQQCGLDMYEEYQETELLRPAL
ncbi:MAG TPA: FAD-binding protein, partial [Anditalea sp.]|nr:FAD-binding protein [Anditalea sp.]